MRELNHLKDQVDTVRQIEQESSDSVELFEMAKDEQDNALMKEIEGSLQKLQEKTRRLQLLSLLSGEADMSDAYLEVNSGAGGTEACDWAEMLLRMYVRLSLIHI